MSSDMRWRINIRELTAQLMVGIHAHERQPQRILVNITVEGHYPARPQSIKDCICYEKIYRLVTEEWTKRTHTELLESLIVELLEFVFRKDSRVAFAKVSLCKPDAFANAERVGVEAEWTREDFERLAGA
jgi:dihydroneopterin aldolase